jgi:threonine synthase
VTKAADPSLAGLVPPLVCHGCGHVCPPDAPYPFRCPNAASGDGADHVLVSRIDVSRARFPEGRETEPFVRYRELSRSYHLALAYGMPDAGYVDLVERLDKDVATVDGRGFTETRFAPATGLASSLGVRPDGVWVKDETRNVSGSHKARHLMGVMIHLRVADELGLTGQEADIPELAIASCGNAALAAAVVARAAGRSLRVLVPTSADPAIVALLAALGAIVQVCPREAGVPGDPTYHALQRAIAGGAIPFTCQGNENGLAIEGGQTLGYEMAGELQRTGTALDRVFVQVGGGALASAVIAALEEAHALGVVARLPRIHAVQTRGGHPLERAHRLMVERFGSSPTEAEFEYVSRHRAEFMWPWEDEPRSVAHGILDDETYDWLAVVRGMIRTGGYPVVVGEERLRQANELARATTHIDVDHTGTSGLAGLMELRDRGDVGPDEQVAVLFTGLRR